MGEAGGVGPEGAAGVVGALAIVGGAEGGGRCGLDWGFVSCDGGWWRSGGGTGPWS